MRNSGRKRLQNRSIKSRLHSLERRYSQLVTAGKKEDATKAFKDISSAFDKAAKSGVVHRSLANRKKSRLAARLATVK